MTLPQLKSLDSDDLAAKIDNVLETMCFVMADPVGEDEIDEHPSIRAWIRFSNDTEVICLQLAATPGFVQEAASGLLGMDAEDIQTEGEATDTLLELANVIGGEVVSLLGGEDILFEMGLPSRESLELDAALEHTSVAFDSMGELLCVDVERGLPESNRNSGGEAA